MAACRFLRAPAADPTPVVLLPPSRRRWLWVVPVLLGIWIALLLAARWPAPFYRVIMSNSPIDASFFAYAGELVREGGVPYVTFWDHKPPLIYLIDVAALTLSGGDIRGVWAASLVTLVLSLGLAWAALRRAVGTMGAVLGTAFFAFALPSILASNLTEEFVLPMQWAAVLLLLAAWRAPERALRYGLGLGILAGLAALLRPNLIGGPLAAGLALTPLLLGPGRVRDWLRLVLGSAVGVALVVGAAGAYLSASGALAGFRDEVVHYNTLYVSSGWSTRVRAAYIGLRTATASGTLLLPLAGWLLAGRRWWNGRSSAWRDPVLLLALVWLPIELALAATSGRPYGHYFAPLFAPLTLLVGVLGREIAGLDGVPGGVVGGASGAGSGGRLRAASVTAALVLALGVSTVSEMLFRLRDDVRSSHRAQQIGAVVGYVQRHSRPGDRLLVWGHAADVHFFSGRRPASRFIYPLPLLTPGYADSTMVAGFLREVQQSAPPVIVDATPHAPYGDDLVPPLGRFDAAWRYPDPARSGWTGRSWWTMTPAMRIFYDWVHANYQVVDSVGPDRWAIYARRPS